MENKNAIIAAVVAVIVIVAAVGIYYGMNNGNDGGDETPTGDKYYFYLDGMGDLNGWYTANGSDAEVALKAALDEAGIEYSISNGWISNLGNLVEEGKYFGTYVFTSNSTEGANGSMFATGPVLDDITGNIVYVTFSGYQINADWRTVYDLNPMNTTSDMMTTGPFATA